MSAGPWVFMHLHLYLDLDFADFPCNNYTDLKRDNWLTKMKCL